MQWAPTQSPFDASSGPKRDVERWKRPARVILKRAALWEDGEGGGQFSLATLIAAML